MKTTKCITVNKTKVQKFIFVFFFYVFFFSISQSNVMSMEIFVKNFPGTAFNYLEV